MNRVTQLVGVLSLASVAACGGAATSSSAAGSGGSRPAIAAPDGTQRQGPPGVSGLLAAISGTTLQVQGASSQTAVTYTSATRITQTVATTAAAVKGGLCVQVRDSTPNNATASPPSSPPSSVTATSVTLSQPVNGSCASPLGTGAGRFGTRTPRSPRPGGFAGRRFGGGAFGKITAVHGTGFTVSSVRPGGASGTSTPTDVTVTTTGATTYAVEQGAAPSALKTGLCVTARGQADSTGTVTATALALRPADNGTCTGGFGGGPGAPGA